MIHKPSSYTPHRCHPLDVPFMKHQNRQIAFQSNARYDYQSSALFNWLGCQRRRRALGAGVRHKDHGDNR
jgi:hypothetical protein